MIQLRTMKHIATSQMLPGVRSIATVGRSHHRAADLGRIQASLGQMRSQEARRVWLNHQWNHHPSPRQVS